MLSVADPVRWIAVTTLHKNDGDGPYSFRGFRCETQPSIPRGQGRKKRIRSMRQVFSGCSQSTEVAQSFHRRGF